MLLINQCSQKILCHIQNEEICLLPHERKEIVFNANSTTLTLSHLYKSEYGTCFELDGVFQMSVSSSFTINEIKKDSVIFITREKVHFELYYTLDRFFCSCDNCFLSDESHQVNDLNTLLSIANNNNHKTFAEHLLDFFLYSFGGTTILFLLFKLIFWFNNWPFSWWYILFFWFIGIGVHLLSEKVFFQYTLKNESQKHKDLKKFSSDIFIKNYFSNPNRKWIGNDIEVN